MNAQHDRPTAGPGRIRRIELELRDVNQLFNSMDPSPFLKRDLDGDAEEFILNWALEYPPAQPLTLRIHLEQLPHGDTVAMVEEAVHNFFAYRARLNQLEFHRLMKDGRTSLLIGLAVLATCLLLRNVLLVHSEGPWFEFIKESVTIFGWVAMWRPVQIYLHDWWPIRRRGRILTKLGRMPVEVVPKAPA